jgi:hypothetical protein
MDAGKPEIQTVITLLLVPQTTLKETLSATGLGWRVLDTMAQTTNGNISAVLH